MNCAWDWLFVEKGTESESTYLVLDWQNYFHLNVESTLRSCHSSVFYSLYDWLRKTTTFAYLFIWWLLMVYWAFYKLNKNYPRRSMPRCMYCVFIHFGWPGSTLGDLFVFFVHRSVTGVSVYLHHLQHHCCPR